jgi:TolB-like protein/Tfp pilus assembly protein PilF
MNEYDFPPHRHEHDFSGPASRKIGELFARVQDFLTKPELTIYSQHTVNPPYTLASYFFADRRGARASNTTMQIKQFIAELRGRGIYQTTAYYSAGAWVLLQIADVVFPALGLPEWSVSVVLVLAAVGFPIALVLTWLFDFTPQGVIEATPITVDGGKIPWSRTHIVEFTLIILLALLVGYLYIDRLAYREAVENAASPVTDQSRTSIAVMPFVNLSDVADMEYLGDGLAEEILNLLAKLNELNVAARTSSFYFKDREVDIREIGTHLGVDHLLEGSVRSEDGKVRVTAQLIKASDGFHLWSETYDRDQNDMLELQDEIASKVVEALQVLLPSGSREALSTKRTVNPAAYDFYLRGRAFLRLPQDASNLEAARELFDRAIKQDQRFADAFAGRCNALLGLYAIDLDVEKFKAAEAACHRALTLDRRASTVYIALGNLYRESGQYDKAIDEFKLAISMDSGSADAHLGLGATYFENSMHEQAEQHFRQAIEMQPNYWQALMSMGTFLGDSGRISEAIPYYERICELMPDSETAYNNLAAAFFLSGDFEKASRIWQRSLELAPSSIAYSNVATSLFFLGRFEEAVPLYHKAVELAPDDFEVWGNLGDAYRHSSMGNELAAPMYQNAIKLAGKRLEINASDADTLAMVGHYYAGLDQRESSLEYLDKANALASGNMYVDYTSATALSALGETDRAIASLERALESGYPWHIAEADANLGRVRELPQFEALTARQQ